MPPLSVHPYHGLPFLPALGLHLDPHRPVDFGFVSHAHADHFARHKKILCSEPTADIIRARFGSGTAEVIALPFDEDIQLAGHRVKLLPAGHIFGSAQIHVARVSDGASLLYTGDFKMRTSLAAEPPRFVPADTLIMETTFGLPHYVFPPPDSVAADIIRFARESVEDGDVPVLLGYSLGKAQEILALLKDAGLPVLLHEAVYKMSEVYRQLGIANFPPYEKFDPERPPEDHVLIFPPNAARSQVIRKIKNRRTAMMSGWGMNPGAKFRYQVDEVFPLSDHADYPGLLDCVAAVDPRRVLTLHGFASDFARDLRARGIEAWSFSGQDQMELSLNTGADAPRPAASSPDLPRPTSGFSAFTDACEAIRKSTGRLRKISLLSDYLRTLRGDDLPIATTFFTGKAFAKNDPAGALQVGHAIVRRALLDASAIGEARLRAISATQNDSGRTAYLALIEAGNRIAPEPLDLGSTLGLLRDLRSAHGPAEKSDTLAAALGKLHPLDAQYLVKIVGGDLRIGLKEGLLEEAIAAAFDAPPASVREANMLLGSVAKTAVFASENRLHEADIRLFTPLKCMLASPEESAEKIWGRLGGTGDAAVWLEDKFDGIRAQLHAGPGGLTEIYSRDLRPLGAEFPELVSAASALGGEFIFDGEIIAFAQGQKLTFFDLQKRLGRRDEGDLFLGPSIPVRYVIFDLLYAGKNSLLARPLTERRSLLESISLPGSFHLAEVHRAVSPAGIDREFNAARARQNEGLIAKDPSSTYSPGRRGKSWLKLKKAFSTLDVVVVKAQQGHGKRSHVLSDYTFSVRDETTGALLTIGKAYSGLTDAEIEQLTEHFKAHTLGVKRRTHTVDPNIVLEIAFDSIQPSDRHQSGLALRFPRIKAWRKDKTIDEIDTVQYARSLSAAQGRPTPSRAQI